MAGFFLNVGILRYSFYFLHASSLAFISIKIKVIILVGVKSFHFCLLDYITCKDTSPFLTCKKKKRFFLASQDDSIRT